MAERIALLCGACNFKFARDAESKLAKVCPNCGQQKVMPYAPLTANSLLQSVSNMK